MKMNKRHRENVKLNGKINEALETTNFNKALHKKYSDILKRLGSSFAPDELLDNPNLLPEFRSMLKNGEMTLDDLMTLNIMRLGIFKDNQTAVNAFTAIRDTKGEKPTVTLDINKSNPLAEMTTDEIENAIRRLEGDDSDTDEE